jgi:hypothetical protein
MQIKLLRDVFFKNFGEFRTGTIVEETIKYLDCYTKTYEINHSNKNIIVDVKVR